MAFCGHCGKQLPEGAKVCPFCGAPVEEAEETSQEENQEAQTASGSYGTENEKQESSFEQSNGFGPQGPQSNSQNGPQFNGQNGPQFNGQNGPQFNGQNGPQGPQFNGQNGPQFNGQNGPQFNGHNGPQGNFQQGYYQNQYYQQGPSQASQTFSHMGQNMNRLVPKSKSEGLEVACFVMSILSIKFSLSLIGQAGNIVGLILGIIPVILLLINKEKTSNKTVQTLALIIGIVGICMSLLGIILVAAHVPERILTQYLVNKASDLYNNALNGLY
ncbi:MAG: zinc-ribbon domain-containing protein [Candidatus Weimeria sp.]